MSWSASVTVESKDVASQIDAMPAPEFYGDEKEQNAAREQFETAKAAAKVLLGVMPGPRVIVSFSGHANGIGEGEKPGFSNDSLNISLYQNTTK